MPEPTEENLDSGVAAFKPIESGTLVALSRPCDVYLISNGEIATDSDKSKPDETFLVIQDLTNYTKLLGLKGNKTIDNMPHAIRALRMQDTSVVYMVIYPRSMRVMVAPEPTP